MEWGNIENSLETSSKQRLLGNRKRSLKVPGTRGGRLGKGPGVDGGDLQGARVPWSVGNQEKEASSILKILQHK